MIKTVVKRDGSRVDYNREKIVIAISKANREVSGRDVISRKGIKRITDRIEAMDRTSIDIEEIQDIIEDELMDQGKKKLAKKYMLYRENHSVMRNLKNTTDDSILKLIRNENREVGYENSNKNPRIFSTMRDLIAGETSKDITDRVLLPEHLVRAHYDGVFHFHDKDYYLQQGMFNCCLVNMSDMLDNGTVMNGKLIRSPRSFQVACNVMTQIISSVASSQYGGQSVDTQCLGKYLRITYDKAFKKALKRYNRNHYNQVVAEMTEKYGESNQELIRAIVDDISRNYAEETAHARMMEELASGVQTIQYQINTLMTTNGQSPFVTLFMYLREDDPYLKENALIIEEILKQRYEGIENEVGVFITPAFPKLIYVLDENNCLQGGEYDYLTRLAVKCSSKRMYPDYISAKLMRENYEGQVFSCMGCRSFLSPWKDENGNYKWEGRFNQGVVSINLPQIGIIANGDMDLFWKLFDERLQLCYEALMCRHKSFLGTISDVSPIHWQYGAIARLKKGEKIDKYLKGGYSTISLGYIGLYELTKAMLGVSHTTEEGEAFALDVMNYMRATCDKWKRETGIAFGLYGTPAESLCYRFAKVDRERFGDIEDITDKGYYTNSYHIDVREPIDAFKKLQFESKFQKIASGGGVSYVEVPNMQDNLEGLESVVKFIYDNIQYAEVNSKSDYCHKCGFDGEIIVNEDNEWECPCCHNKDEQSMTVVRRTCGYLGERYWNTGKTKEIALRVTHL